MSESLSLYFILVLFALADSVSLGTLIVPAWLLMASVRVRVSRMLVYLMTVYFIYFTAGVALMLGAGFLFERFEAFFESRTF